MAKRIRMKKYRIAIVNDRLDAGNMIAKILDNSCLTDAYEEES